MTKLSLNKKNEKQSKAELKDYAGKWVALFNERVVAHNSDLKDLMEEIDSRNLRKKISVFLVPRRDEGPYIINAST